MQTIDERSGVIRIHTSDLRSRAYRVDKLGTMTVEDLMVWLLNHDDYRGKIDLILYQWKENKGKHQLKALDFKLKLTELNKKWTSSLSSEQPPRLLLLGAKEKFNPPGSKSVEVKMSDSKQKASRDQKRKSRKKNETLSTTTAPPSNDGTATTTTNTNQLPVTFMKQTKTTSDIHHQHQQQELSQNKQVTLSLSKSIPNVPSTTTTAFPPPPPPLFSPTSDPISAPIPPPISSSPPKPLFVSSTLSTTSSKESESQDKKQRSRSIQSNNQKEVKFSKKAQRHQSEKTNRRKSDDKRKKRLSRDLPSIHDNIDAEEVIKQINPFVDPTGQYKYENEPPRPEFAITAAEFQQGYNNLNTNNITRIARSEHHQKILLAWVNKHLKKRNLQMNNLQTDFQNGVLLINLLEIVSGQKVKKYFEKPTRIFQYLENLEIALKFLSYLQINVKAEPQDIYNGKLSTIVGILFLIISKYKDGAKKQKSELVDITVKRHNDSEARLILEGSTEGTGSRAFLSRSGPATTSTLLPPPPPPLPTITVSTTADVVDPTTNLTNAQTPNVTKEKTVSSISTTKQPQLASEPKRNLVTEKSDGNVPSLPITKERENITSTKKPTSLMKPSSQLFGGRKTTALAADYDDEKEVTWDEVDETALVQDIIDLDKFQLKTSKGIDIAQNEEIFGNVANLENLLSGIEGMQVNSNEQNIEDINLDLDKIEL